jgi:hypothetical protein
MQDDPIKLIPAPEPSLSVAPEEAGASMPPVPELSPEEQMARFEAALKEEDWGHQPC